MRTVNPAHFATYNTHIAFDASAGRQGCIPPHDCQISPNLPGHIHITPHHRQIAVYDPPGADCHAAVEDGHIVVDHLTVGHQQVFVEDALVRAGIPLSGLGTIGSLDRGGKEQAQSGEGDNHGCQQPTGIVGQFVHNTPSEKNDSMGIKSVGIKNSPEAAALPGGFRTNKHRLFATTGADSGTT